MREDISALLKEFEVKTFGNKQNIERLEAEIRSDETLRYISFTNFEIKPMDAGQVIKAPGTIMISDQRILLMTSTGEVKKYEFPIPSIESVYSKGNGLTGGKVSFVTTNARIDFLASYKKRIFQKIEELIQDMIGSSLVARQSMAVTQVKQEYSSADYAIVECKNCGASNIVKKGMITRCPYCDQPITA